MCYKLRVSVEHSDDWTMLTGEFNVVMKTITNFPAQLENRYVNVEVFNLRCNSDSDNCEENLEGFIREIKRYKNVFKLIKLTKPKGNVHKSMNILTLEDYSSSIRKLVNDMLGFFASTISERNLELYTILFPLGRSSDFKELKQRLNDIGSVHYFEVSKIPETTLFSVPMLTKREIDTIRCAWSRGYFNYPKDTRLEDIANSFGLTRSTIDFYIRSGVRKSIEYLINSNIYNWNP